MFGFLFKKTFHDTIDKFPIILGYNIYVIALLAGMFGMINVLNDFYIIPMFLFLVLYGIGNIMFVIKYDNKTFDYKILLSSVKYVILKSILLLVGFDAIFAYLASGSILFNIAGLVCLWAIIGFCMITVLVINVMFQEGGGVKKGLKRSILVSLAHVKETLLFYFIYVLFIFSTPFPIFGGGFSLVLASNFYRLIEMKQVVKNKNLSWKEILQNEKKIVDRRNILDVIFPNRNK